MSVSKSAPVSPLVQREVGKLYLDHHGWLVAWLRRKLSSTADAADIAQDAFLRVLTSSDVLNLREPRPFLATIASRLVANLYRRRALESAYLQTLALLPEADVPGPEARTAALEALTRIDEALDGLPARVREAFLLAQLDGMTYARIAEHLGISVRTVNSYMLRAVQQCYFSLPDH